MDLNGQEWNTWTALVLDYYFKQFKVNAEGEVKLQNPLDTEKTQTEDTELTSRLDVDELAYNRDQLLKMIQHRLPGRL